MHANHAASELNRLLRNLSRAFFGETVARETNRFRLRMPVDFTAGCQAISLRSLDRAAMGNGIDKVI